MHQASAAASLPLGIWLTASAPAGAPRVACGLFAAGVVAMFAASGLTHFRRWSRDTTEVMVRIDHTGIYFAIAGTASAFAILGMPAGPARVALWVAWVASGLGIIIEWLPSASPKGLNNTIYLALGWGALATVPYLWTRAGPLAVVLMLAGGVLYTVGVIILARKRPDPNPKVFGYHEIWHVLVIAAVAFHYVDVAFVLL